MHETRAFKTFRAAVVVVLAAVTALPLYVMVTSSLKPLQDVRGAFSWWPSTITFQPFVDMWTTVPLARYFVNSLVVSSAATLASLAIAIFASYAVSRYRFRGRSTFTTTVLSTQMFPGVLFLLPLFIIFVNIEQQTGFQFVGTRIGLIITYLTFSLPFSIWMLSGYLDNIPQELDEAARVDGCSPIGALFRVVLPAARPGVIAVAIYAFMTAWGEVLFASVMTTEANRTLAVGIRQYSTQTNVYWNEIMAASLVVSIPVVIGFLLLQRHFVAGLTAGAVK
ncbi:carbohydrate ABC transporter permease [Cellulomonas xiejunii]|uniref:Carbohydrate ABC transporter permease n=1 Tax=Cellulomonas xiejunii TaxID=2968083 RepID=A0ABY5KTF4_9CELL|nr:carbohydrate ABC transporter permease [Cellulomonas xiejunii]MCC2313992.1 carbohydrate ABC transporter permease [Cellulomonas xiejunii]MCC2322365.1 carbohydrate ABC transporter permease [Cellulomonas xiejunii]UUI72415.1 carbohydrate ABC transporter permease [Cellulomonas xiejunii]